jgi:TPR repeat protein
MQPAPAEDKARAFGEIQKLPVDVLERATQGDANAQYDVAHFYLQIYLEYEDVLPPETLSLAVQLYKSYLHFAAEGGHEQAQLELGLRYSGASETSGDREDLRKAAMWFRKAAEQGHPHAQLNLALAYHEGSGVPQNYTAAARWYEAAADAGITEAQVSLGFMYAQGEGVPQDYARAHMWFNLAAASFPAGDIRDFAVTQRDNVAARMTPDQIAEAQSLAREWLEQHPTGGAQ